MLQVLTCLAIEHDRRLVALAFVICVLASGVTISLFHRAQATEGHARSGWLGLCAAAGGCGIWATHFIAMLAYEPDVVAGYNLGLTILSLIFASTITAVGLSLALRDSSRRAAIIGGAVVGVGIAAMHYTGMLALELPGQITWSLLFVFASLLLSSLFGALAFHVATRRDNLWHSSVAAALLAAAILSLHFTAMAGINFVPDPTRAVDAMSLSATSLSLVVAGAAAIVLGMCLVAALSDRRSKDKLRQQKILLDAALANMSQGLCMFDAEGCATLFNERYTKLMGTAAVLKGQCLLDLFKQLKATGEFPGEPEEVFAGVLAEIRSGSPRAQTLRPPTGRVVRVTQQPMEGGGWVATFEDITDWQKAQAKISHMARHDALTDLPNRTLFRERLQQALRSAKRGDCLAVLCLDLDHFKGINDSLGHPVGDDLLKEVAVRLAGCLRKSDTVSRLGGDEFAIVQVGNESEASSAASLASRLVEVISAPYEIQGHQVVIGLSVGISVTPNDGSDPDQLLKNADMALYRAKADGRGTFRFFEAGMDARAQARRLLEVDLRAALLRSEFVVHYQPIQDIKADRIVGFEALLRWNHPLRGLIPPLNFIPLAEETGLIVQLGDWVLQTACKDAAGWSQDVCVAVNLSPAQFKDRNLVSSVVSALEVSGLAACRLELEITESVLLQESDITLATLHKLRGLGIRISMDDFGTGYSSLSYLRSFPFDKIKIDRSFVSDVATRDDSMAIVRAVTGLGKSLGISTTAEGVETSEQLALLRLEGCTEVQGYLFSPPRPAEDVEIMLAKSQPRVAQAKRHDTSILRSG
ncbi:bifunctional diguanylate cyclase/phosphodiesterase [Bradyrhizobium sp.]|jgi:diguanylate cyclase (GGDEF)-like protein|uniref:bifunctional diguanylate cyclase/phosphodiesterase n=1 Tax=Bradyrhizobium sp. TaxID=376 RepID=UPI003C277DC6